MKGIALKLVQKSGLTFCCARDHQESLRMYEKVKVSEENGLSFEPKGPVRRFNWFNKSTGVIIAISFLFLVLLFYSATSMANQRAVYDPSSLESIVAKLARDNMQDRPSTKLSKNEKGFVRISEYHKASRRKNMADLDKVCVKHVV